MVTFYINKPFNKVTLHRMLVVFHSSLLALSFLASTGVGSLYTEERGLRINPELVYLTVQEFSLPYVIIIVFTQYHKNNIPLHFILFKLKLNIGLLHFGNSFVLYPFSLGGEAEKDYELSINSHPDQFIIILAKLLTSSLDFCSSGVSHPN